MKFSNTSSYRLIVLILCTVEVLLLCSLVQLAATTCAVARVLLLYLAWKSSVSLTSVRETAPRHSERSNMLLVASRHARQTSTPPMRTKADDTLPTTHSAPSINHCFTFDFEYLANRYIEACFQGPPSINRKWHMGYRMVT